MQDPKTSPGAFLSEALEAYDKKKLHEIELQKLKAAHPSRSGSRVR